MSRPISVQAIRKVLRGPAHLTDEYATDLVASMRAVDRALRETAPRRRKHGRTTRTPAIKGKK